jgi:hypothetical protein
MPILRVLQQRSEGAFGGLAIRLGQNSPLGGSRPDCGISSDNLMILSLLGRQVVM